MPPLSFAGQLVGVFSAVLLSACSSSTSTIVDAAKYALSPSAADNAVLNPNLQYLRLTTGKNVALLVLGYVDNQPESGTEVWYSGQKETIRLWNGRLTDTAGLKTNWHSVRFQNVPSWRSATIAGAAYRRQRDVMPGYKINVSETVHVAAITAPTQSNLQGIAPDSLHWFEEKAVPDGLMSKLPPARFAVDLSDSGEHVIYSEQCISSDLCFTFQAWPVPTAKSERPSNSTPAY